MYEPNTLLRPYIPNRAARRNHLQRSSHNHKRTPGRRIQVVPCGEHYTETLPGGGKVLVAHHFRTIRHRY